MNNLNYEKDVNIDESALDIEWLEQPRLALKYAKHLTNLKNKVAKLEEHKKTIRSELIDRVNRNPLELTNKKSPNAGDIEAYYRRNEEYKEIVENLLDLQEELDYAEMAYKEISWTRKQALEQLVQLHGLQYFAGPKTPRDLHTLNQERQKKVDSNIARKINRKNKNLKPKKT